MLSGFCFSILFRFVDFFSVFDVVRWLSWRLGSFWAHVKTIYVLYRVVCDVFVSCIGRLCEVNDRQINGLLCCHPQMWTVMHSLASVCPVRAVTFESFDLKTSFCYASTSSWYVGQIRLSRSRDQCQSDRSKKVIQASGVARIWCEVARTDALRLGKEWGHTASQTT